LLLRFLIVTLLIICKLSGKYESQICLQYCLWVVIIVCYNELDFGYGYDENGQKFNRFAFLVPPSSLYGIQIVDWHWDRGLGRVKLFSPGYRVFDYTFAPRKLQVSQLSPD
jgi:hypothetical protein